MKNLPEKKVKTYIPKERITKKNKPLYQSIARRLIQARELLGKSQQEMAVILKIKEEKYRAFEEVNKPIDAHSYGIISTGLGIGLDWLISGTLPMFIKEIDKSTLHYKYCLNKTTE